LETAIAALMCMPCIVGKAYPGAIMTIPLLTHPAASSR
jgi:hypothetical protein